MNYKGKAHKVGEHIDTDAIIPARFLVTTDAKKLGENCMSGLEPDWVKRVAPGDILVAGRNFGCGSSREHAPIAILGAGMSVVIGHSFARIFIAMPLIWACCSWKWATRWTRSTTATRWKSTPPRAASAT